ncbi:MAG: hypothetical protein ACYC0J_08005, partial [Gammaproteobacteria bacterium]
LSSIPDDIKQLTQVIKSPQASFYRIEQQNKDDITIAEVKRFVIHLVTEGILKAQLTAGIKTAWHEEDIIKTYINESDEITRIASSNRRLNEPSSIWESRANNPQKVYSFNIEFDDTNQTITSTYNINLFDKHHASNTVVQKNVPREYFLDESCIYLMAHKIELSCLQWAIDQIEIFLINENVLYDCFLQSIYSDYWPELITDKFYLSLILDKKIRPNQLTSREKPQEFDNLMNSGIKELLRHGILRFMQAKFLTEAEVKLASHPNYLPLLLSKAFDIDNVSIFHCRLLTTPCLAQLVFSKKIAIEYALNLPTYLKPVFSKHSYTMYFAKSNAIDWEQWTNIKRDVAARLVHPNVEELVINQIVSIDDLNQLRPTQLDALKDDSIAELLLTQKMSFELFKMASYRRLNELTGNRLLFQAGFFSSAASVDENRMPQYRRK